MDWAPAHLWDNHGIFPKSSRSPSYSRSSRFLWLCSPHRPGIETAESNPERITFLNDEKGAEGSAPFLWQECLAINHLIFISAQMF